MDRLAAYDEADFLSAADGFDSIVLVDPPLDIKNTIALHCWKTKKSCLSCPISMS